MHVNAQNGNNGAGELARHELSSTLRAVDRVWAWSGGFVYLLPECDRDDATGFVTRLAEATGTDLATTIACFPADGLTGGLLIELALGGANDAEDARPAMSNGSGNGNGNGNGARFATQRRLLSLLSFIRRRRRAHAKAAIEWTEITPTATPSELDEQPNDSPLVANAERAAQ